MSNQRRRILTVDDDPAIRRLLVGRLSAAYDVRECETGQQALDTVATWLPDLVLLDILMPGMDGYETCLQMKALPVRSPPQVIMVSGNSGSEELARAFECGADDYLTKPVDMAELQSRVKLHFRLRESEESTVALRHEVDSHHVALKSAARQRMEQLLAVQDVAVLALAKLAESRDNETGQHIVRMRDYSYRIAHELRNHGPYKHLVDARFLADLYRSAPLHDIGKVGIADGILFKPGRLTFEEYELMKRHADIGGSILNDVVAESTYAGFLSMAALIAQYHHEWWNGSGYPTGLGGEEIPLAARIVAVADVYDALTSQRPYKMAWSASSARRNIQEGTGTQFDPAVVDAFERCFGDILKIQQQYVDQEPILAAAEIGLELDCLETV